MREQDIARIVDAYERRENIDNYAYVASYEEIQENDYNLSIPRYVDTYVEEEPVDLDAVKRSIAKIKAELHEVEAQMERYLRELGL